MYVITEWFERYEVNDKGQPARRGDKLRASPLLYIRSKVHGHHQSAGFAAMQRLADKRGVRAYEVFGVFHKLMEIAAAGPARTRGILLNHRGGPATLADLCHTLRETEETLGGVLDVLTDNSVGWIAEITWVTFPEFLEFQENWSVFYSNRIKGTTQSLISKGDTTFDKKNGGNMGNFPGIPGALYNETKRNETELNETQRNETTPGKSDKATIPPVDATKDNGEIFDDCSRDSSSTSTRPSDSARLKFGSDLRKSLGVVSKSDTTALWNLQQWADRLSNTAEIYERILAVAKDSKNGRNPIAVFFSRVDQELGYRARVEADKRK